MARQSKPSAAAKARVDTASSSASKFDARAQTSNAIDKLFGVRQGEQALSGLKLIEHDRIEVNPQARTVFPAQAITELAESISQLRNRGEGIEGTGILQPLLVRPLPKSETSAREGTAPRAAGDSPTSVARYRLVAGERRYRASQQVGLIQVPCLVVAMREDAVLAAQLIENLQRQDLSPLDKARSFQQLMETQGLSFRDAAQVLGKSRSYLSDYIALLSMHPEVQQMVSDRSDTLLHARLIQSVEDAGLRAELIQETLAGASRRSIERRINYGQSNNGQGTAIEQIAPFAIGHHVNQTNMVGRKDNAGDQNNEAQNTDASGQQLEGVSSGLSELSDDIRDLPGGPSESFDGLEPLQKCLDPAVALLSEAARQLKRGKVSRTTARQVQKRLEAARRQIEQIERAIIV